MSRIIGFFSEKTTDTGEDLTTKGDLHGYSTENTRIPIGDNDQILTADSSEALGLKWVTSSGLSSPLTANLVFNDNVLGAFGTGGGDSYIKHDGSHMYIKSITGNAILQSKFQMEQNSCLAVNIATVTIASGDMTGTDNVMSVNTEGSASTDDLDHVVMNGAGQSGAYFTLKAYSDSRTVVVKDGISGTGELLANGDFTMDNGQDIMLFLQPEGLTNNYEVSRSDNGS